MPVTLYGINGSGTCRSVLMTAKALGVPVELKVVNPMVGDTQKPEFVKINPQHTIPTLDDNGFIIWESRAIVLYLINEYGKDSGLFPTDNKQRAKIDQRLHFDLGYLIPRYGDVVYPIFRDGLTSIAEGPLTKLHEAYAFLETFLADSKWFVGDKATAADICLVASVSSIDLLVPVEKEKYPKLAAWFELCKTQSWYEANVEGLEIMRQMVQEKLGK